MDDVSGDLNSIDLGDRETLRSRLWKKFVNMWDMRIRKEKSEETPEVPRRIMEERGREVGVLLMILFCFIVCVMLTKVSEYLS